MGRFKELVDIEEGMSSFRTKYNILRVYRSLERKNEPKSNPPWYKLDLQSSTPKKAGILFKIQARRG